MLTARNPVITVPYYIAFRAHRFYIADHKQLILAHTFNFTIMCS